MVSIKPGMELKSSFEKASQQYETLMTAPRTDLGVHPEGIP